MAKTIIPASIEDAIAELNGLGALLTAKEWSRAAIVYAFTRDEGRGQPGREKGTSSEVTTFSEFAEFGIVGLKSTTTVARYHRAWAEHGTPVIPGDTVDLPRLPWPADGNDRYNSTTQQEAVEAALAAGDVKGSGQLGNVLRNPNAVRAAILHDPKIAEVAAEAVIERAEHDAQVRERIITGHRDWDDRATTKTTARKDRERSAFDVMYETVAALHSAERQLKRANELLLEVAAGTTDAHGLVPLQIEAIKEQVGMLEERIDPTAPDFVGDIEEWLREHSPTTQGQ